ncbi:MAG: energy transducer TonB [Acidobacteria bacterium]|nr:energy transducer TonB [Acidobacteriota bacterium]MBI3425126.1 energy transducer TonB [Acidobacteriota bacterium]
MKQRREVLKILFGACSFWLLAGTLAAAQTPLRLAVVDLSGDEAGAVTAQLRELAKGRFELLDPALIRVAAQGAGYSGSLNLRREEARTLGLSLGCEFYLLGRVQSGRRLGADNQPYYEAWTGLFLVETRTGDLAFFGFAREQAPQEDTVQKKLALVLPEVWQRLDKALWLTYNRHLTEIAEVGRTPLAVIEVLNDDQLGQQGQQPIFYQRLKPEYTSAAEAAGVTATVELEAVFQADGNIGEVTVVRWAGFGLDESAIKTVKKLRFKPARQAEKEVTIRGLVRYNFRRPPAMAERLEEAERLKRSLRELTSPVIKSPLPHP